MSTQSQREGILTNVIDTLKGINGASPYLTKVDRVERSGVTAADFRADDIVLSVYEAGYGWTNNAVKSGLGMDFSATLLIGIRAWINGTAKDIETVRSRLKDDIGGALYKDRRRGQIAHPVDTTGLQFSNDFTELDGSGGFAGFVVTVTCTLQVDPRNP